MSRKRINAAVIMGLTLIVAACSSGGATTAPSAAATTAASEAPVTSTEPSAAASEGAAGGGELVIWADDKRAAALKPLADQFAADNGVTVTIEAIAADIIPNFLTASQAGTAPDVVVWAHDVVGNLVANGAIDPVQLSNPADFDPLAIQGMTFDGQLYGIPYSVENIGLFVNTDLVTTGCPATMEDLVKTGQALKDDKKTTEILALQSGQSGDAYHIYPLFASGGGSFFGQTATGDPDPANVTVDSAESIAAGELIKAIGEKGDKALKTSIDNTNAIPLFFDGKAPFLVSGPWAVADIEKAGVKYDICPIPPFAGGKPRRSVRRRQRLLSREQGQEQGAGAGVRHELPDHAGSPDRVLPGRAAPTGAASPRWTRSRRLTRTSPSSRLPPPAAPSCRASRRWARSGDPSGSPRPPSSRVAT